MANQDWEEDWRDVRTKRLGGRKRFRDLTGQRFGRLVVRERAGSDKRGCSLWLCECVCFLGSEDEYDKPVPIKTKIVSRNRLVKGAVKSCGCLMLEYQQRSKTPPPKPKKSQSTRKKATRRASYLRGRTVAVTTSTDGRTPRPNGM